MRRLVAALTAAALLAGCATTAQTYTPIVDPAVGDQSKLPEALAECRALASQVDQGGAAAATALGTALVGVAIGAMFGLRGQNLAALAGSGALVGGIRGSEYAGMTQAQIVQRCLTNRGFAVLG